jgi:acetyl esterase/lipase
MAPSVFAQNENETKGQDRQSQASDAPISSANNPQLKGLLERFPQADTNKDGVLTLKEAVSFGRKTGTIPGGGSSGKKANKSLPRQNPADIQTSTFDKWKVFKDVQYDTRHERNVLDFYQADSETPTPVVVYFHGGGFRGGDKEHVTGRGGKLLKKFLEAGVSVASCNYPFLKDADYLTIMHHCSRSIQFIRSKQKEWNINPKKFGAYGASAGALISEWVAYSPDIAKHDSNDPIERLSKSLVVVGAHLQPMGTEAFALRIMKKGGPPLFVYANSRSSDKIHDPKYSKMIKQKADELGIPAALVGGGRNDIPIPPNDVDPLDLQVRFFVKYLGTLQLDDVVGRWKFDFLSDDGRRHTPLVTLKKQEGKLKGTIKVDNNEWELETVRIDGGRLIFTYEKEYDGLPIKLRYVCKPDGEKISGRLEYDLDGMQGESPIEAVREAKGKSQSK